MKKAPISGKRSPHGEILAKRPPYNKKINCLIFGEGRGERLFCPPLPSVGAHGNVCVNNVVFLPLYYIWISSLSLNENAPEYKKTVLFLKLPGGACMPTDPRASPGFGRGGGSRIFFSDLEIYAGNT